MSPPAHTMKSQASTTSFITMKHKLNPSAGRTRLSVIRSRRVRVHPVYERQEESSQGVCVCASMHGHARC